MVRGRARGGKRSLPPPPPELTTKALCPPPPHHHPKLPHLDPPQPTLPTAPPPRGLRPTSTGGESRTKARRRPPRALTFRTAHSENSVHQLRRSKPDPLWPHRGGAVPVPPCYTRVPFRAGGPQRGVKPPPPCAHPMAPDTKGLPHNVMMSGVNGCPVPLCYPVGPGVGERGRANAYFRPRPPLGNARRFSKAFSRCPPFFPFFHAKERSAVVLNWCPPRFPLFPHPSLCTPPSPPCVAGSRDTALTPAIDLSDSELRDLILVHWTVWTEDRGGRRGWS